MTRVNCWRFNSRPATPMTTKPVPQMTKKLWGKLVGDRGYLSQALFEQRIARGLQLITPLRKNMQNQLRRS